jgi:hypothetical protein
LLNSLLQKLLPQLDKIEESNVDRILCLCILMKTKDGGIMFGYLFDMIVQVLYYSAATY